MKLGKSPVLRIEGKSLPLNLLLIIINITGLVLLVKGYHETTLPNIWLLPLAYLLFLGGIVGLVLLNGFYLLSYVSRAFVGGLFIVSGLVKANDPLGFSYKLEEYFEDGALAYRVRAIFGWESFSLEWLIQYALALSVIICVIEIVLGIMVIINAKMKLASWLLLGMMLFFTALTFHTSECNPDETYVNKMSFPVNSPQGIDYINKAKTRDDLKIVSKDANTVVIAENKNVQCVSDCGCFGDALKGSLGRSLTPRESFWKDLILDYFVLIIFIMQWRIKPNSTRENVYLSLASLVVVTFFSWVFDWYFPLVFAISSLLFALWIRKSGGKFLANSRGAILGSSTLCALVVLYVLMYLPLKDYRPYAVGSNLLEKMSDGIDGQIENTFVYKNIKTGKTKSMTQQAYNDSKIWENKDWAYDTILPKTIIEGRLPSITEQFNPYIALSDLSENDKENHIIKDLLKSNTIEAVVMTNQTYGVSDTIPKADFIAEDYDTSYTKTMISIINPELSEISILDYVLTAPSVFVLSAVSLEEGNWSNIDEMKAIQQKANEMQIPFIVICGSGSEQIKEFKQKYQWNNVLIFNNDRTELKAVCRSNPGLLLIQKGIVKAKYPQRGLPTFETIQKNFFTK